VDIAANRPPTTAHNVAMPLSAFDQITQTVYSHDVCKYGQASVAPASKQFDLNEWRQHATSGGLDDKDRVMLAKYYGSADSVFEWGLGESSYMAGYFNVSRYAGVDSDAEWVSNARDNVSKLLPNEIEKRMLVCSNMVVRLQAISDSHLQTLAACTILVAPSFICEKINTTTSSPLSSQNIAHLMCIWSMADSVLHAPLWQYYMPPEEITRQQF